MNAPANISTECTARANGSAERVGQSFGCCVKNGIDWHRIFSAPFLAFRHLFKQQPILALLKVCTPCRSHLLRMLSFWQSLHFLQFLELFSIFRYPSSKLTFNSSAGQLSSQQHYCHLLSYCLLQDQLLYTRRFLFKTLISFQNPP